MTDDLPGPKCTPSEASREAEAAKEEPGEFDLATPVLSPNNVAPFPPVAPCPPMDDAKKKKDKNDKKQSMHSAKPGVEKSERMDPKGPDPDGGCGGALLAYFVPAKYHHEPEGGGLMSVVTASWA